MNPIYNLGPGADDLGASLTLDGSGALPTIKYLIWQHMEYINQHSAIIATIRIINHKTLNNTTWLPINLTNIGFE